MNQFQLYKKWYNSKLIRYNIVHLNNLTNRESMFMAKPGIARAGTTKRIARVFRGYNLTSYDALNSVIFDEIINYGHFTNTWNIYYSLATYSYIPWFKVFLDKRKSKITEFFNEDVHNLITAYDLLIDIDSPNRELVIHAKTAAEMISDFLDEYNIPYYLRFSGMGYHLIIPYYVFEHLGRHFNPHENISTNIYKLYNDFTLYLKKQYSCLVDTGLHDSRRVTKTPYTLVFYKDETYICWPFKTKEEFKKHKPTDYKILDEQHNFNGFQNLYNRGQTLFNEKKWSQQHTDKILQKMRLTKSGKKKTNPRGRF